MGSRLHRFELERPLPIIDRIVPCDAKVIVGQQLQPGGVIGRNPQLASGTIFPEMNLYGMLKGRLNDLDPV